MACQIFGRCDFIVARTGFPTAMVLHGTLEKNVCQIIDVAFSFVRSLDVATEYTENGKLSKVRIS